MEVPKDVQRLAQATRYLATQLKIICKTEIGDEKIADVILKQAIHILKEKLNRNEDKNRKIF